MNNSTNSGRLSVALASIKMALATSTSRILGLVREQAMAWTFGASGMTDAFTVAYRIPNMLRDLFAEGAFSSSFVPIFTEAKIRDPLQARRLLWSLFVLLGSLTFFISIVIMIFAPSLAALLTSGDFLADPLRAKVTVELIRIMAPFLLFISLAALFMGALNSLRIFFIPALAPAFFNIVMIAAIFILPPHLERAGHHPILSLGLGVLVGGLLQMLIQLPMLLKVAYGPIGPLSFKNRDVGRIFHRLSIGTIGIAANQINLIVTTILATGTVLGAVSWLNYAFRLFQLPVGVLGVSIATSNLVHFSQAWKEGKEDEAVHFLRSAVELSLLVMIPAAILLCVLSLPVANIIFERGAFTSDDTSMTALALSMYAIGLPSYGMFKIFSPTFFALDRPQLPVYISVVCIGLNVIFCLYATPRYGFFVLALGTSLSMILNSLLQTSFLIYLIKQLSWRHFLNISLLRLILAGLACYFVGETIYGQLFSFSDSLIMRVVNLGLCGFAGLTSYVLVLAILGDWKKFKMVLKR